MDLLNVWLGRYVRTTSNENVPSTEQISSAKIAAFHRTSAPSGIDEANQHGVEERGESEDVFEVDGASSSFLYPVLKENLFAV